MMFRNSLKLFVANFSVFWKLLLYKIVMIALCMALLIPAFKGWINCLTEANFFELLTNFATKSVFSDTTTLLNDLFILVNSLLNGIKFLYIQDLPILIYSLCIVCIVMPLLFELSSIPTGEGLYSYMASLTKSSFMASFISKIGRSFVYALSRVLLSLPIVAGILVGLYHLLSLCTIGGVFQIFLPIIIILYFAILISLYLTIFCGWMPASVVFNISSTKAFKKGIKAVLRKFFKLFSCVFVIIFFASMFSFMFTTFSLLALIPLASVALVMLEMVMFFESQGMRYYVDLDTIISPKKFEQCEKFNKIKNII